MYILLHDFLLIIDQKTAKSNQKQIVIYNNNINGHHFRAKITGKLVIAMVSLPELENGWRYRLEISYGSSN
jgi:hypothetical protein